MSINLDFKHQRWIYLFLVLTAFVLYGNTIQNDYALDDGLVITQNSNVQKGILGIPAIISNQYLANKNITIDYRPVVLVSFAMEYQFFKLNPHVSHFINVLLYALCLIAIYIVLIAVFKLDELHPILPFVITLIYAVHPIHTEVVASLKNRDELFSMLFGLCFLYYANQFFSLDSKKIKYAFLAMLFILLSIVSKLIGIVFFGFLLLILIYKRSFKLKISNFLFIAISFSIILFIIYFNAKHANRNVYVFENALALNNNPFILIATSAKILLYHLKMLFISFPFRFYYGYNLFPLTSIFEVSVIISILLHSILLIVGLVLLFRKNIIGVFILCYLGCLVLYSNYPYLYVGMFSERALFVSSLWFIAALVVTAFYLLKKYNFTISSQFLLILLLPILFAYSFMTIRRNFNWKNAITLMSTDMPYLENSVNANYIYANNLHTVSNQLSDTSESRKMKEMAASYLYKTIRLFPAYPLFHLKLAQLYKYELNNTPKAIIHLRNALVVDSTYDDANFELGKIYNETRNYTKSNFYFEKIEAKGNPDSLLYFYLAKNANDLNDLDACYKINEAYKNKFPTLEYPYMNLGVYYSKKAKDDSAVIYFEKAIELGNRNPNLIQEMSKYYQKKNDKAKVDYYNNLIVQLSKSAITF